MDTETSGETEQRALSADVVFELLANSRRRQTLNYLRDGGETTLRTLSEQIAASENGVSVPELSAAQRKRVSIGLYQCHLPKLHRAGVIDYDRPRGTISRTDLAEALDPLLELAAEFESGDE